MFIGSLKKSIFSFLRSKFDLYQGNSAFYASFFCAPLPKIVCNFLIIRGTIRKKTPLSHARPAATVVAPPLPRPPGSGANMPPALRPPVWDRSQGAQKDVRELSVILGALGALCHPITAQKDVRNQTEGTREHRRMSEGASELPILLYIRYTACEISQFYRVCDFSPVYSFCEISPVFLPETSKNVYFVKKHENFSRKTKIFPFFLASFKNSLYLCTVKS